MTTNSCHERITVSQVEMRQNRLYASQTWVLPHKTILARDYNSGVVSMPRLLFPQAYSFNQQGKDCFLIGDGHHRTADALLRGLSLDLDLVGDLGNVSDLLTNLPDKFAIRFATYGFEGIWPFRHYIGKYKRTLDLLNNADPNTHRGVLSKLTYSK